MAIHKLTLLGIAVLGLLQEKPMHPYEMAQLMRDRHLEIRVKIKTGSLYHTVERLEKAKYIEIVEVQKDGRRPEKTVYGITEAGQDAYIERARTMLSTPVEEYPEFISALSSLHDLDPADALEQLNHRSLRLIASTGALKASLDALKLQEKPKIYWLDWCYRLAKEQFELAWVHTLIEEIEHDRLQWPPHENSAVTQ